MLWFDEKSISTVHTLVEACVDTECDVDADDSELETDSGDPGRLIFLRFRGRPFNLGAVRKKIIDRVKKQTYTSKYQMHIT